MIDSRKLNPNNFYVLSNLKSRIKFILRYAILAPSTHNTQPWMFKIKKGSCEVRYDSNLMLPKGDPAGRDLHISLGAMLKNLTIAAEYFNAFKSIEYFPRDSANNAVAEVFFRNPEEPSSNPAYADLFKTIPARINSRGKFFRKPVDRTLLNEISKLVRDNFLRLDLVTEKKRVKSLASLTAKGMEMAHSDKYFRKEMSNWMRSSLTKKKDGLPGYALKMPLLMSFIVPTLIRFFNFGPFLAKQNYRSISSAPLACVISAKEDNKFAWLKVGELAEEVMLKLQSRGVKTSIFVAAVEINGLYRSIQKMLNIKERPQFLFIAGYQKDERDKFTPRHKLEDKLVK